MRTYHSKKSSPLILTVLFALIMSLSTPLYSENKEQQKLLIIGDSLSAGFGLFEGEEWPALLQIRFNKQGFNIKVINASISGETSLGGASRIEKLLKKHEPSWVVLELGANDGLQGQSLKSMRQNLNIIISQSHANNSQVLLLGMHIPPNYGSRYANSFHQSFIDISQSKNVDLVPFFLENVAGIKALNQSDGIHPTAEAQPIILNNVWPAIKTLISR